MTDPRCDRLDEYLCGWLSPSEAAEFETHLAHCPACQSELAVQKQIDRLLGEANAQVKPVPTVLAGRIERDVRTMRRRRIGWACAVTAAAASFLALGIWEFGGGLLSIDATRPASQPPIIADRAIEPSVSLVTAGPQAAVAARVTLADPSAAIALPIESHSPNVTLVRIYPTIRTDRQEAKGPLP
jgi:anti-sigma factor RsiW